MFRWDDLGVLLQVHRHGTLAGAGKALGIDASTASRRLRGFEGELGHPLFDRTPDGLLATDLALRLLPHAESAEAAALAAATIAAGVDARPEGLVRLASADALGAYVIAPALPAFLAANPGLRLELMVATDLVDLTRREADLAIRFVRPTRGDLVARRVAGTPGYATYVAEALGHVSVDDLDWIGWSPSKAHLPEAQLYHRVVGVPPRFACDNLVVMMEAVLAGAGAILLPRASGDNTPGLARLDHGPAAAFPVAVWLVTHRALRDVPRVRLVSDWLASLILGLGPGDGQDAPPGVKPMQ